MQCEVLVGRTFPLARQRVWAFVGLAVLFMIASARGDVAAPAVPQSGGIRPPDWASQVWRGEGAFRYEDSGRTGNRCLMIGSEKGGDLGWTTKIEVEPDTAYRLSGWIRTEEVEPGQGRGALLSVPELGSAAATPAIVGATNWTYAEVLVRTIEQRLISVNCLLGGGGLSTGRAWYDDIRFERIDVTDLVPVTTIHADRAGPPIDPYIYGQFIEHLGRCIYGGIWAEMLEDRKFYFPITVEYAPYRDLTDTPFPVVGASPWQIIGLPNRVSIVTKDAFVGRHTLHIQPGNGIRQCDLAVIEDKDYVGHIWLAAGTAKAETSAEVSLVWGGGKARQTVEINKLKGAYRKYSLRFTAHATTDKAMLEVFVKGGDVLVGTVSLMPADNVRGMRADTLRLLKQLGATMYRWPGGNFVSGYNWRDGIGDRDRRPPRKNPAWTGVEHNDFGLDEFIDFCREVGAEPVVTVNTGFGDAYSAAQEVEYCNGSTDTIGGLWRAKNGHSAPYGVKYWCVGNEMWGDWQLGFMQLKHYTLKHNEVAEAMWQVDPSIQLIGSGQLGWINKERDAGEKRGWSRGMLEECADHMNLLSEHFYCGKNQDNLVGHVNQLAQSIREKAEGQRKLQKELGPKTEAKGQRPEARGQKTAPSSVFMPIALDEWNYWYGPHLYGELGCEYDLSDALGVAVGLHEYFRNSDIIRMAHYAQTVNVIGCIKTTKTDAFLATTALPLMLYRHRYGSIPVEVTGNHGVLALDVAAAWTEDRKALTIAVVNPNREPKMMGLKLDGVSLKPVGTRWTIAGDDPSRCNTAGDAPIQIVERPVQWDNRLQAAPLSITLVRFPVR